MKDVNKFSEGFNSLSHYLKGFAYKLTNDLHKAEDLFQDTALLAFRYQQKFIEGTNLKAWLSTIMKNTFINNFRRKQRRGEYFNSDLLSDISKETVSNNGEHNLSMGELQQMIDGLKEDLKQPFAMAYEGYKYQEISAKIGVPEGTVKSRIFMARKQLKSHIKSIKMQESLVL